MKKKLINDITVLWNDAKYDENIFDENMIIYKLSYIDDKFYIGKTKKKLIERLIQHCSEDNITNNGKHIKEHKYFIIDVLYKAEDEDELNRVEKNIIRKYIDDIAVNNNTNSSKISNEIINSIMLNEVLYR